MTKPTKKRLLFVDDERRILESLQRMLHPMRRTWKMSFVESGKGALEAVKSTPRHRIGQNVDEKTGRHDYAS